MYLIVKYWLLTFRLTSQRKIIALIVKHNSIF